MKKTTIIITVFLVMLTSLLGCSTSQSEQSQPGTADAATTETETNMDQTTVQDETVSAAETNETAAETNEIAADVSNNNSNAAASTLTVEEAKEIVTTDAGLQAEDIIWGKVEQDLEDGKSVYEIEFYSSNTEYDYVVNASNGEILSFESDSGNSSAVPSDGEDIGEDAVKSILLAAVPGAADSDIHFTREYDDEILEYECSVIYNEKKYEFTINAADGTVIEKSEESIYDD